MITITHEARPDGSIKIKVGRRVTILQTGAEADAFLCGAQIAREALAKEVLDTLSVKITSAALSPPSADGEKG